jgi:calcineurin-like phosphoesterase family protein
MHSNVYITSDTHFGHPNIVKFKANGQIMRPFDDYIQHDEFLIEKWNSVVRPQDKVYHLGDVCISRKSLKLLERLNGKKVLIRGNHDIFHLEDYAKYFKDVRACHKLDGCLLTHIPVHKSCMERFGCNIHGHTHANIIKKLSDIGSDDIDPDYLNVCVEHTNYTPLHLDEVFDRIKKQGGSTKMLTERRSTDLYE